MMKENDQAERRLRASAIKYDLADTQSLPKEREYQAEQKKLLNRLWRFIRPGRAGWTRQDSLYNLEHNPELGLPLQALEAVADPKETARVLASEELKALGIPESLARQAMPILEQIGETSYRHYTEYNRLHDNDYFYQFLKNEKKKLSKEKGRKLFMDEVMILARTVKADWEELTVEQKMPIVREWAIENASQAGIDQAPALVEAITGEAKDPQELLSTVCLADLIDQVKSNLPGYLAIKPINQERVKETVLELAKNKNSWLESEEVAIIEKILENEVTVDRQHAIDVQALMVATMGIHLSWSAFQGPRSVVDQKELFEQAQIDKEQMNVQEFTRRYSNLRVIRPINRTFAEMQVNKFREGYRQNEDAERGVGLAVFEILKDLINIGLPEQPVS